MAVETYYPIDSKVSGINHLDVQTSAPAGADATTGWTLDTNATAGEYADMAALAIRPGTNFTGTPKPTTIDTTLGNGFRLTGLKNGTYAAGNWQFDWRPKAASSGSRTIQVRQLLWKSANADGSGGSAIGTVQASATSGAMGTAAQTLGVTYDPGAIVLSNEYLFVLVGLQSINALSNYNIFWRIGSLFVITTPDFTAAGAGIVAKASSDYHLAGMR